MVEVKRHDYKAFRDLPERYECHYYYKGKEIAWYRSINDVLALRTEYIGKEGNEYTRALNGMYAEAYKYLFDMLGADETTNMTEYMNL